MEPIELIILVIFALAFVKTMIIDKLPVFKAAFMSDINSMFHALTTGKGLVITLIVLYPLLFYTHYLIGKFISNKLKSKKDKREKLKHEEKEIIELLKEKLEKPSLQGTLDFVEKLEKKIRAAKEMKELAHYESSLSNKLNQTQYKLKELEHEERLNEIKQEKRNELIELERIKQEQLEKEHRKSQIRYNILTDLEAREKHVFIKDDLEPRELEALLSDDFNYTTEYCVFEKRLITVLAKPTMHHSITHTFLVWSAGRLLESLPKVSHILEHDTRDADVTFRCKKEIYALEIETGTLLSKKAQLRSKVSYLNRKYPGKWMFIVSNKNLAPKYSKFGPVSQRKDMEKKLKKMLKLAT